MSVNGDGGESKVMGSETAEMPQAGPITPPSPSTYRTRGEVQSANRKLGQAMEEWARSYLGAMFHEVERVGEETRGLNAEYGGVETFDLLCDKTIRVEVKACAERILARHEKCGTRPGRWHFDVTKEADFYLMLVYDDEKRVKYAYFASRERIRHELIRYSRQGIKIAMSSRVLGRKLLRVGLKKVES